MSRRLAAVVVSVVGAIAVACTVAWTVQLPVAWQQSATGDGRADAASRVPEKAQTVGGRREDGPFVLTEDDPSSGRPPRESRSFPRSEDPERPVRWERTFVLGQSDEFCGASKLRALGFVRSVATEVSPAVFSIELHKVAPPSTASRRRDNAPPLDAVVVNARATNGWSLFAGAISRRHANATTALWLCDFASPAALTTRRATPTGNVEDRRFQVDFLVTWVGRHYLGQTWRLPPRDDDPPFDDKRRKCVALTLNGTGCDRFGVNLLPAGASFTLEDSRVSDMSATEPTGRTSCQGDGAWLPVPVTEGGLSPTSTAQRLLRDPVGLNTLNGRVWQWSPTSACSPLTRREAAMSASDVVALQRLTGRPLRVLLFGDSMMVEWFHLLRAVLLSGGAYDTKASHAGVTQGKQHGRRWMSFESREHGVQVKLIRCYTTSGGHSVLPPAASVVSQVRQFRPHLAVGNLAVLHWQQNMRSQQDWRAYLAEAAAAMGANFSRTVPLGVFYAGHTMIHMGRTQGLQPSRTADFTEAACEILRGSGLQCFRPLEMSLSRRESAYDGQHWACYHRYGGVAYSILSQFWNVVTSGVEERVVPSSSSPLLPPPLLR